MGVNWTAMVGDCRDLPLPDESVEAVVTDPPYGLSFMGKDWDHDVPGPEYWTEVKRVMKPGAHLLAFGGTRTWHWLTVAIEEAGFEVRDCLSWMYGCLPEDAEILTEDGWVNGLEVDEGDTVAAWDPDTESVQLEVVEEKTEADHDGPMVRIQNDNTDQLLTPGHRVYCRQQQRKQVDGEREVWFPDDWTDRPAGAIETWRPIKLPLAGEHSGDGIGGEDYARLLAWIWTEGGFDKAPSTGVRIYQSDTGDGHIGKIQHLLDELAPSAKHYTREREYDGGTYTAHCWFFTGTMAQRVRSDLPDKHPTYDLLWRMDQREKRAFVRAAMYGDGSGNAFYQENDADLEWFQTLLHTVGWQGRIDRDKMCVYLHRNPETELQSRHMPDGEMVERYKGKVWCVTVPSRAFVARWRGRVFVTGNTGFPKSHDISKAIDKAAGAEREVVGEYERFRPNTEAHANDKYAGELHTSGKITAPATEDAKRWDGWGTALKPSWEPIVWAQKELKPVPAERVLYRDLTNLIGGALCLLLSSANSAEAVLRSSPVEPPEETSVSVAILVALIAGAKSGGRSEMMATSSSPETVSTCSNIASLWSVTLDALWSRGSTSTTETATEAITALKTLRSLLSGTIPDSTIRAASQVDGQPWNVTDAESSSSDGKASSRAETIAAEIATWRASETSSSAGSAAKRLRRQTQTVVSALKHALTASTTGSEVSENGSSESAPTAEADSPQSRPDPLNTATGSAWQGTTDLTPDWEPIVLAMKPTDGTFAENALEHGVAGLNIDGTRISTNGRPEIDPGDKPGFGDVGESAGSKATGQTREGRWPANTVLSHTRWCRKVGTKRVRNPKHRNPSPKDGQAGVSTPFGTGGEDRADYDYADEDGKEEVEDWDCPPSCAVRQLDEHTGEKGGGYGVRGEGRSVFGSGGLDEETGQVVGYGDTGGASRFYFCSEPYPRCTVCGCELPAKRGVSTSDPNREKQWKPSPATTAETSSKTTRATDQGSTSTARKSAWERDSGKSGPYVSIAGRTVCPRCEIATAQNRAHKRRNREGRQSSSTTNRGTFGTPMNTHAARESGTSPAKRNGRKQSLGARPVGPTPNLTHARNAGQTTPTGTMTTTTTPKRSAGSAGPATSKRIKRNTGAGAKDSPTRLRYCAKASRSEREAGLPDVEGRANQHPTVKPIDLCRWLVRLVTRPDHTVLDPFMGSGSIGCAAVQERRNYIGLDLEPEYVDIARQRIEHWTPKQRDLFLDREAS